MEGSSWPFASFVRSIVVPPSTEADALELGAAGSDPGKRLCWAGLPAIGLRSISRQKAPLGLAAYNRIRRPIGERIMLHGRKLGTHLGVNLATDEDREMWKLLQDHRAMMDWIAVPGFLDRR